MTLTHGHLEAPRISWGLHSPPRALCEGLFDGQCIRSQHGCIVLRLSGLWANHFLATAICIVAALQVFSCRCRHVRFEHSKLLPAVNCTSLLPQPVCACSASFVSHPKAVLGELQRGLSCSTTVRSKQYSTNGSLFLAPIGLAENEEAICCHKPNIGRQTPGTGLARAHVPGNCHKHKSSDFCL